MTENNGMTNQDSKKRYQTVLKSLTSRKWLPATVGSVAAVIILAVLPALMRTPGSNVPNKNQSTFTVHRDNLRITVTESGSIKARNATDIKSEVEGQTKIISIVPEGTYITPQDVNNGKILVELDSSSLTEKLTQTEIEFASAQASYAEAKEAYTIQLKQNESDITSAELKVKFALMDFRKYLGEALADKLVKDANQTSNSTNDITSLLEQPELGGSASQKLRELNDKITMAEENLARAEDNLQWTQKLYDKTYIAESQLKADKLEVQSLRIQLEQARTELKLFKLYEFPKESEKLLSDYNEAGRQLERTHAQTRSKLAQADARLKSAESRLRWQSDSVAKIRKQVNACKIKAPAPGLVVYGSSDDFWRRRNEPIEEGATVYERQKIISLPNTSEMSVEINVHETSVDKVKPGQTAKITVDAFPDKTFDGKVLKVAPLPDPQRSWLNPDLKVYTTEVSIDGSSDSLKPGMSAKAEILIDQLDNVIVIPVQTVANHNGKKICFCLNNGGPQQREVLTGAFNDTFVQVLDGLKVGEQVLLNPPRLTETTADKKLKPVPEQTRDKPSKTDMERRTGNAEAP